MRVHIAASLSVLPFIPYPQALRHPRLQWLMLAATCLLTACTKEKQPIGPQIIYAGLGLSNRLEVGMTLQQIRQKNGDLEVVRIWKPDTWPWEKLFQKPLSYHASIPSAGADIWDFDETKPVNMLNFAAAKMPPTILRGGSNDLAFKLGGKISRQEITRRFGEPNHHISDKKELPALFKRGQSVSWTNAFFSEQMYFPADGVIFVLQQGELETFTIVGKIIGSNPGTKK